MRNLRISQTAIEPNHGCRDNIFEYPQNLENALSLIQQAVSGEKEDIDYYNYLIDIAPSEEDKQIISSIRNDEMKHYNMFIQIYCDITGHPVPQGIEEPFIAPPTYCDGLKTAIFGENTAIMEYPQILYAMQPRVHINMLTGIISDEIRHGILLNYLYSKNNCNA